VATDALKDALDAARYRWLSFAIGNEAVGLFGLAESLLGHVVSLVSAGAPIASMIPRFVKDRERLIGTMKRASRVGSAVSFGLFLFGLIVVPIFIPIVFPKYIPSLPLYLGISPTVLLTGIGLVINAVYPALRLQKPLFFMLAIRVGVSLSFLYLLIPIIGNTALAVEFVIGSAAFMMMRWFYLRGKLGERLFLRDFVVPRKQDLLDIWTFAWSRVRGLKSGVYERS
jgi:O-antigen/teichoic acid export membrane protein